MTYEILKNTKAINSSFGSGFEAWIKRKHNVVRLDGKLGVPDFLWNHEEYGISFLEAKNYASTVSLEAGIYKWKKKQPRQIRSFKRILDKGFDIYLLFNLKRDCYLIKLINQDTDNKA